MLPYVQLTYLEKAFTQVRWGFRGFVEILLLCVRTRKKRGQGGKTAIERMTSTGLEKGKKKAKKTLNYSKLASCFYPRKEELACKTVDST